MFTPPVAPAVSLTVTVYWAVCPVFKVVGPLMVTTTEGEEVEPWQLPQPDVVDFRVRPVMPPGRAKAKERDRTNRMPNPNARIPFRD